MTWQCLTGVRHLAHRRSSCSRKPMVFGQNSSCSSTLQRTCIPVSLRRENGDSSTARLIRRQTAANPADSFVDPDGYRAYIDTAEANY